MGEYTHPTRELRAPRAGAAWCSFRTLKRTGVEVNPGSRIALGTLTIDVGGTQEVVTVTAETPMVQAASGERSFSISTDSVANLPLANRSYDALLAETTGS